MPPSWSTASPCTGSFRVLTGDRPTGSLHLGHYFGSLRNRVRLQDLGVDVIVLIPDYQVITDRDTAERLAEYTDGLLLDYLALGIDPARSTVFCHSAVPALNQLERRLFLSLVSVAELNRQPHGQGRDRPLPAVHGQRADADLPGPPGRRHPVLQGTGSGRPGRRGAVLRRPSATSSRGSVQAAVRLEGARAAYEGAGRVALDQLRSYGAVPHEVPTIAV
ncbi:hypothetical protein SMICM17S_03555 [Streptomyces microflavus]